MFVRHVSPPLMVSLLSLGACKHGSPSDPAQAQEDLTDPTGAEDLANASELPPFRQGLSARDYLAVMRVAGCEGAEADSAQCVMCPDAEPATVELFAGDFTKPGRRGVVVSSPACDPETGDTPTTRFALIEQDDEGGWRAAGEGRATHLTECRGAADLSGRSHLLCVAQLDRYGTTSTYHTHFGWMADRPEPVQTTLVELAERDNCALNYSVTHVITGPNFEPAEGGSQLVVRVDTTTGPFTKTLDACPEDGFSGPLEPERATKNMTSTFTFELTPEGLRERDGKGSYVSLGAEFEALMEQ